MRGTEGHRTIDTLLAEAEIPGEAPSGHGCAVTRGHAVHEPPAWPPTAARGWRYRTAREQAVHDLDLAIALIVGAPEAAAVLARLVDRRRADPEGALVFACLLHLIGHREAAQFWWQFAAGGGSRTAAFCLYLYHRSLAEFRDADHWREQAARLARTPGPLRTAATGPAPRRGFLLPDGIRRDLLRQCHRGRHPRLPAAVEAVLNRLRVTGEDEDFGEIPQPAPGLPEELARARPR
ncbi:hypothetical protein V1L54_15665 [Streptomyces sp. TRM 70361]|uniref:hypothetical protein n=1 Tax=Streptomyces sp. TRM 70361 TaxID=3116553 RepID=UPI002E7AF24B|nr:hypothetical protein [Streptomyces sp. TRM 70361]MEE1940824.1 hypothetical protein [Streptomyces sp. TRM 70361]